MKKLDKNFLNELAYLSAEEITYLCKEIEFIELQKDDYLLKKDQVCSEVYFLVEGTSFSYDISADDASMNIIDLHTSGEWIINTESFVSRQASKYHTQANTNCSCYRLSLDSAHKLVANSQNFLKMGKLLVSNGKVDFYDNNFTPDKKYKYILENRPKLLQHFPLTIIASYLKVTPETLSRVRKRLSTQ